MPKLVPALLFVLVLVLGVAADDVRAGCRPELAPNHPDSCQAQRGRRARARALRVVEELGSRGLDYYSTTPSRPRLRDRSGARRLRDDRGVLGDDRGADGRPRGGAALRRDATSAEADRARQRAIESEQANRTQRETQRLRDIDQRTRDLSGGRPFPRGTIGIGPQTR